MPVPSRKRKPDKSVAFTHGESLLPLLKRRAGSWTKLGRPTMRRRQDPFPLSTEEQFVTARLTMIYARLLPLENLDGRLRRVARG
jgi:hypothetical protein